MFKELERLGAEKVLPSRIRFVIRDVLELKRSGWVPRREVFTARKLEDIRSQAEAELGMISSSIAGEGRRQDRTLAECGFKDTWQPIRPMSVCPLSLSDETTHTRIMHAKYQIS